MPQLGTPLNAVNEENAKSLQDVETAYNAEVEATLSAGRSDESLNESGQMTARQRLEILVDQGTWCQLDSLYNPGNNKDGSTGVLIGMEVL